MLCFYPGLISNVLRLQQQGPQMQQRINMNDRRLGQDHCGTRSGVKHPFRKFDRLGAIADEIFDTNVAAISTSNLLEAIDGSSVPWMKSVANHQLGIPLILQCRCTITYGCIQRSDMSRPPISSMAWKKRSSPNATASSKRLGRVGRNNAWPPMLHEQRKATTTRMT